MKSFLYSQKTQRRAWCPSCQGERAISRRAPDHRTHLLITLLTGGLWGIVWVCACWGERNLIWRCRMCRHSIAMDASGNPISPADSGPQNSAPPGSDLITPGDESFRMSPRIPRRFRREAV